MGMSYQQAKVPKRMTGSNIWDLVLARVETKVNRHSFYTWFKPTAYVAEHEGTIRVRVPNALFRDWLTKHYAAVIDEALAEVQRVGAPVAFITEDMGVPLVPPIDEVTLPAPEPDDEVTDEDDLGILSPRYSFDTFIVGTSNQFAHAACRAVAEAPSRSYNPLFIYGGVGLGKTHLMHAIGHYVVTHLKNLQLTYISS
jgi:chromosomal replication initiator protein